MVFLRPKLLNILLASFFLINLDFLVPHIAQLDNSIVLVLLVFKTRGFMFSVFFYTLNKMIALLYTYALSLIISSMSFLLLPSNR